MLTSAFDLGEELNNRRLQFILHKPLWDSYTYSNLNIDFHNWASLKYLNITNDDFNNEIESIPQDKGGLYLFYIKCPIIVGMTEYPCYIGRAQHTAHQNLRKRVKEYYQHFISDKERPKITRMFRYWKDQLHLAYLILDENDEVINLEKDLINSLLLPMNDQIPNQEIKQAVKAFNL